LEDAIISAVSSNCEEVEGGDILLCGAHGVKSRAEFVVTKQQVVALDWMISQFSM